MIRELHDSERSVISVRAAEPFDHGVLLLTGSGWGWVQRSCDPSQVEEWSGSETNKNKCLTDSF